MNIEFVSFTGKYPCLCFGTLMLRIDGKVATFGDSDHRQGVVYDHHPFRESGGVIYLNDNGDGKYYVTQGYRTVHEERLPDYLKPYSEELAEIMNKNVPHGHCGGCL